jgi:host factor-I protein
MPSKYGAFEQNQIIDKARKRRLPVQIFLKNGIVLKGKVVRFDLFTVLFKTEKGYNLIYKHAISTIIPLKKKSKKKSSKPIEEKKSSTLPSKKTIKTKKKKNPNDV